MFKKTRKKIVAAIMSVLVLLWVGTLGVIYASSYASMAKQNERMLRAHAEMYTLPPATNGMLPPDKSFQNANLPGNDPGFTETPMFQLSTFYMVAVSYEDDILEIKNDSPTVHTNDELVKLAQSIIKDGKNIGSEGNLAFFQADKGGYILVTFMDNTVLNENAMTLFRYTLIFGSIALVLFFVLSVFLARKILNPIEESYQKQKQFISDIHRLGAEVLMSSHTFRFMPKELSLIHI